MMIGVGKGFCEAESSMCCRERDMSGGAAGKS